MPNLKKIKEKSKDQKSSLDSASSRKEGSQRDAIRFIRKSNGFVFFESRTPFHAGFDDNCRITKKLLVAFSQVESLQHLSLVLGLEESFPPKWMEPLVALKKLKQLDLEGDRIVNEHLAVVSQLPNLSILNIKDSKIDDNGVRQLKGCHELRQIDVTGSAVTIVGEEYLENNLPKLKYTENLLARSARHSIIEIKDFLLKTKKLNSKFLKQLDQLVEQRKWSECLLQLELVGRKQNIPGGFWRVMQRAADSIGLKEQASRYKAEFDNSFKRD